MSNKYILFTDTSADLPASVLEEFGIPILKLSYTVGGENYGGGGAELPIHDFYDRMREGAVPTTSQVSPDGAREGFEKVLLQGYDILYIAFSSGLSGTYNSGVIAANELIEKYPDRRIVIVDSLCASLGQGLLVYKAAQMKRNGASLEEVAEWAENNKLHVCHMFTVDDLVYLYRGGRVSRTATIAGTILGIKPVMHVDNDGHLVPIGKVRGRKQSLNALVDEMEKRLGDYDNVTIAISHGDCLEEAKYVCETAKKKLRFSECIINSVGTVIGSHSGPGTMALFFFGEKR